MLDSQNKEILKYESFGAHAGHHKKIKINEEYIPMK